MILKRFQLAKECLEKYKKNLQRIEGRQALAQVEVCLGVSPGWKDAKVRTPENGAKPTSCER